MVCGRKKWEGILVGSLLQWNSTIWSQLFLSVFVDPFTIRKTHFNLIEHPNIIRLLGVKLAASRLYSLVAANLTQQRLTKTIETSTPSNPELVR